MLQLFGSAQKRLACFSPVAGSLSDSLTRSLTYSDTMDKDGVGEKYPGLDDISTAVLKGKVCSFILIYVSI